MRNIVIVEGCDGSGKSNLIRAVERIPGIPYIARVQYSTRPRTMREVARFTKIEQVFSDQPQPVIFDRHPYISEPIYGNVVRNNPLVDWKEPPRFLGCHTDPPEPYKPLIIYCRPPTEAIVHNVIHSDQMEGVKFQVRDIIMAYDLRMSILRHAGADVRVYNYTVESAETLWREVYSL
jgi:hypothetical protein